MVVAYNDVEGYAGVGVSVCLGAHRSSRTFLSVSSKAHLLFTDLLRASLFTPSGIDIALLRLETLQNSWRNEGGYDAEVAIYLKTANADGPRLITKRR